MTLVLKGKATLAQKVELMKLLFDAGVGPVIFEDQIEEEAPPPPPPARPASEPAAPPETGANKGK